MPPTAIASKRIQKEMKDWKTGQAPEGFVLDKCEDLGKWEITMQGPEQSAPVGHQLYKGKTFRVQVKFGDRYPLESPEIIFLQPIPVHPHIYSNGHICLDVLYDGREGAWSPALTIAKVCLSLCSMLASNSTNARPEGDEDYCRRVGNRSPKTTRWVFEDDKV